MLSRRLGDKTMQMHQGTWDKSATNCYEIRGKILGIVGYGHIGTQLSVLAESIGMKVIFYDIENKLPLGNSRKCQSLDELLREADFVTLHVPQTEATRNMISSKEIARMKKGSYLLNASRGTVVVIEDLAAALKSGHLLGAAVDVYPTEPAENIKNWENILRNCPNTILTPHIGGSTEEAQLAIGREVSEKIIKVINTGSTGTAVNFPPIELPYGGEKTHRILNIHKNVPGVLKNINSLLGDYNVHGQICATAEHIGYLIVDVEKETSQEVKKAIEVLPSSLRTRILY
jgi:D-3-phosphoglycerate dehydrogenase